MATSKKFSELPVASSMNNGDLFAVAQEDAQAETGYTSKSATALVVGKKLNGDIEYATDLPSFPSGYQNPLDALEYLNSKILDLYPVNSASGSIANFTTSLALPLVALKAYIQAQGGGGTPSAPVAITGWSALNLYQRGKNLAHFTNSGTSGSGVVLYTINKSEFTINSTLSSSYGYRFGDDAKILLKKGTYYLSSNIANQPNNSGVFVYNTDTTTILARARAEQGGSFTLSSDTFISIGLSLSTSTVTGTFTFQIEAGSTKTDYEPYNGNTTTIQLGQTVYGGYIDKNTGKLKITVSPTPVDLGSLTWKSGFNGFYTEDLKSLMSYGTDADNVPSLYCSIYKTVSMNGATGQNEVIYIVQRTYSTQYNGILVIQDSAYSTPADFKTAMDNILLYYPLATPIETDITIPDITALVGENNIFADSGNIDVSFKQSIQEYIDAKIAETQALVL